MTWRARSNMRTTPVFRGIQAITRGWVRHVSSRLRTHARRLRIIIPSIGITSGAQPRHGTCHFATPASATCDRRSRASQGHIPAVDAALDRSGRGRRGGRRRPDAELLVGGGPLGLKAEASWPDGSKGRRPLLPELVHLGAGSGGAARRRAGAGDEVMLPSFTFVSCANAVVRAGARPVFADVDPRTLNIDPAAICAAHHTADPRHHGRALRRARPATWTPSSTSRAGTMPA